MPTASEEFQIVFYDMPKVASTSVKQLLWEARHKRTYKRPNSTIRRLIRSRLLPKRLDPGALHAIRDMTIEGFDATPSRFQNFDKVALLRDPIARLHSAWKNKARHSDFRRLGVLDDLAAEGLDQNPDYGTFIDNLDAYRRLARSARIHTVTFADILGPDVSYFDQVFTIENIKEFEAYLSGRAGKEIALPRRNTTENETRSSHLSPEQIDRVLAITAEDYHWANGIYSQEAGLQRFLKKTAE